MDRRSFVANEDRDAGRGQLLSHWRHSHIAARDLMPTLMEQPGKCAHSRSTNTNDVNPTSTVK
jgi:hypothetical protein